MRQPMGFIEENKEHKVCKLNKPICGLKQSARAWNQTINNVLLENGYYQSKIDQCLFKSVGEFSVYELVCVDDLLVISKNKKLNDDNESLLKSKFKISERYKIT